MVGLKPAALCDAQTMSATYQPPSTSIKAALSLRRFFTPFHHHLPRTTRKWGLFSYPQPWST